jgi:hypothetical protein
VSALRRVPHNLIRLERGSVQFNSHTGYLFPCGHGRSGRQQKDKRLVHAFRLTERHKCNKRSVGKAQPMLTHVGGGGAGSLPPQVLAWCSNIQCRKKYTISYDIFILHARYTVVKILLLKNMRHRMRNKNTYDIVYDIDLRHCIRHKSTNLRCRMLKVTYDIVYDLHFPKHTTS